MNKQYLKNIRALLDKLEETQEDVIDKVSEVCAKAIFDGHLLYFFGTGSIRGFALTLGIGVATSMYTAIFVTHKLLDIFVDLGVKNQKLYV